MSNIKFRVGNKNPLTHQELDNNFKYLRNWEPGVRYLKDEYVEHEVNGTLNLWKAKYEIDPVSFFNQPDWKKFGDTTGGVSGEVIDDVFVYEDGVLTSPFELTQTLSQLIALEVNGDDRVDTNDYYYEESSNQIFWTSTLFDLSDGDTIVVKYITSDSSVGGGSVNQNLKPIRTISPAEASIQNILSTDVYISIKSVNISSGFTLQLPASPAIGHEVAFFDATGNVGTNGYTYTIQADVADNIEGNASITITSNYQSLEIVYLGDNLWKVV